MQAMAPTWTLKYSGAIEGARSEIRVQQLRCLGVQSLDGTHGEWRCQQQQSPAATVPGAISSTEGAWGRILAVSHHAWSLPASGSFNLPWILFAHEICKGHFSFHN